MTRCDMRGRQIADLQLDANIPSMSTPLTRTSLQLADCAAIVVTALHSSPSVVRVSVLNIEVCSHASVDTSAED